MASIRVMMIGPYPRSADRIDGGVAAAVMYLSQALVSLEGVELIGVRIARSGDESREDRELGWPVVDLPLGRLSLSTFYRRQKRRLQVLLRQYEPHIVHGQGADLAGLLATGCGRPAIVTIHGLLGECARYQSDPMNKLRATLAALVTERRTVRRAKDLIAISPYVARYYAGHINGRIHDIPNPVAPAFFRVKREPERGRLLFAGRIANGKGLVELLVAVARNGSAVRELVLAGATPDARYETGLRKLCSTLGLADRVRFAGFLAEPALLDEFARAEALVLPSHQETAPMVIQQAMAAGLAVIATSIGGVPNQIEHEVSGLMFAAGDVGALSNLIARLEHDAALARRLGESGKVVAESRFQAIAVARATATLYRSVLGFEPARAA